MNKDQSPKEIKQIKSKLQTILTLIALAGALALLLDEVTNSAANFAKLTNNAIYISLSHWDLSLLFLMPTIVLLTYAGFLRLMDSGNEKRILLSFKLAIFLAATGIIVRIPYGVFINTLLEHHNYTRCPEYTTLQQNAPTVWVKHKLYCIKGSEIISEQLLEWLNELHSANIKPSPRDAKKKALSLLSEHKDEGL